MDNTAVRVALASDLHNCHIDWYGVKTGDRLNGFVERFAAYCAENAVDHTLLLGDYSLDFWQWEIGGSYVHSGVSNTQAFFRTYASRIPTPVTAIPGNHEQYSDADFYRFTGFHRRGCVWVKGNLFILLDNYGLHLDPKADSDGTYSLADVDYARKAMEEYPGTRVFLCAHFFDWENESREFRALVREPRVAALFQGHTHRSDVIRLGGEYGGKCLCQTGNYSYSADSRGPEASFWGWRELVITPRAIETHYITPENDAVLREGPHHQPAGRQDGLRLEL